MKTTIALIMAAGDSSRMGGMIKQLLPIGDTTIIGRILTQLRVRETRAIIVTHRSAIAGYHHRFHKPEKRDTVCDSLLSTEHLWDDRTIVLLGDVVYSNETLDLIMGCSDPIRVFGNTWEVFAIVFDKSMHAKVKRSLRRARKHVAVGVNITHVGKLRHFYRDFCGLPMDFIDKPGVAPEPIVFCYIPNWIDWTMDIDTHHDYEMLQTKLMDKVA